MMKNVHVGWGPVGLTRIVPNPTQITLKDPGKLEVGEVITLKYTANIQGDISWQSSNTKVAEIDENGLLTAKGDGTVTITLTITKDGKEHKVTKQITVKLPYSGELKNQLANCDLLGDIKLEDNVTASLEYACAKLCILNLNGKTLKGEIISDGKVTDSYGLKVTNGTVTITDSENNKGTIVALDSDYSMAVWVTGGTVNITGGTFKNSGDNCDLIYASGNGTINISGGYFEAAGSISGNAPGTKNPYSVLNVKDANWKPGNTGTAKIIVTGGTFKNFNPANNLSEGPNTTFINKDKYVVVKAEKTNDGWLSTNEVLTQAHSGGEDIYYMVIAKSETPPVEDLSSIIYSPIKGIRVKDYDDDEASYLNELKNKFNPESIYSGGELTISDDTVIAVKNPENVTVTTSLETKPIKEYFNNSDLYYVNDGDIYYFYNTGLPIQIKSIQVIN